MTLQDDSVKKDTQGTTPLASDAVTEGVSVGEQKNSTGASLAELRARVMSMGSVAPARVEGEEVSDTPALPPKPAEPVSDLGKSKPKETPASTDITPPQKSAPEPVIPTTVINTAPQPAGTQPAGTTSHVVSEKTVLPNTPVSVVPPLGETKKTWGTQSVERVSITGVPLASPLPTPTKMPSISPTQKDTRVAAPNTQPPLKEVSSAFAPAVENTSGREADISSPILHKKVSRSPLVQAIRTFRTDAMQVVDKSKVSVVGALAAEEERRLLEKKREAKEGGAPSAISPGAFYLLGIATALIVLGAATFLVVRFLQTKTPTPAEVSLPSIIFTEDKKTIPIADLRKSEIMDALVAAQKGVSITLGAITGFYPTITPQGGTPASSARLATTEEFFSALGTRASPALLRALSPNFMFGIHEFSENEPFFILSVVDYDNTYAGMLLWEPFMNEDLAPLFGPSLSTLYRAPSALLYRDAIKAATTSTPTGTSTGGAPSNPSTASTTIAIPLQGATTSDAFRAKGFEDARFRNKEVRVLRADDGAIVLMYSFLARDTLVITTNEFTLKEVLTRLTSKRF